MKGRARGVRGPRKEADLDFPYAARSLKGAAQSTVSRANWERVRASGSR